MLPVSWLEPRSLRRWRGPGSPLLIPHPACGPPKRHRHIDTAPHTQQQASRQAGKQGTQSTRHPRAHHACTHANHHTTEIGAREICWHTLQSPRRKGHMSTGTTRQHSHRMGPQDPSNWHCHPNYCRQLRHTGPRAPASAHPAPPGSGTWMAHGAAAADPGQSGQAGCARAPAQGRTWLRCAWGSGSHNARVNLRSTIWHASSLGQANLCFLGVRGKDSDGSARGTRARVWYRNA